MGSQQHVGPLLEAPSAEAEMNSYSRALFVFNPQLRFSCRAVCRPLDSVCFVSDVVPDPALRSQNLHAAQKMTARALLRAAPSRPVPSHPERSSQYPLCPPSKMAEIGVMGATSMVCNTVGAFETALDLLRRYERGRQAFTTARKCPDTKIN